jgi:hypothetical protein
LFLSHLRTNVGEIGQVYQRQHAIDTLVRELPESVAADYAIERLVVTLNAMPDKPGGGRVLHFKTLDRLTRVRARI